VPATTLPVIGTPESLTLPPLRPTLPLINPALLALARLTLPPLISSTAQPAAVPKVLLIKSADAGRTGGPTNSAAAEIPTKMLEARFIEVMKVNPRLQERNRD